MDEQELLHRISVDTNVNIELLKELYHDADYEALVQSGKTSEAIQHIRRKYPRQSLAEAKFITEAFAAAWK